MKGWKLTGIISMLVIILSIPLYLVRINHLSSPGDDTPGEPAAAFVGSGKCSECHRAEYDKWRGSHHDLAMDVASEATVLGDFNDAVFEHFGASSRFYRKDGRFFVHTRGPEGHMGDFEVTHTFGAYPLQQYLVPFAGGRLQCLPIAWDVLGKKWYHLYPESPPDPHDWLYWTNAGQNWNGMCAECHSTNLKKNYNSKNDAYHTTWSEIDVACEACHGPGSGHVAWAELPDMARPPLENHGLAVRTSGLDSREAVELCAPCHSRRAILGDYSHAETDLLDSMLPSLLTEDLYFADGQILEEVYVYGSFTQSKMYHRNVRCSDCHDVHSVKAIKEKNALCLQCHQAAVYDSRDHHFHKKPGESGEPVKSSSGEVLFEVGSGAQCVQCHMPGRYYMGVDYRPDHGFRIPRPDLSLRIGTPDACLRCHLDKTSRWLDDTITRWYGPGRKSHYGEIIAAGRTGTPSAKADLIRLAGDTLYPVIVRATALNLLRQFPDEDTRQIYEMALMDPEALMRRTAVGELNLLAPDRRLKRLVPMLYDPVKAVRIEAARQLADISPGSLDDDHKQRFEAVLAEYRQSMEYSADFSFGRFNLANLYVSLRETEKAIENYRAAIRIDERFIPARINLAMLYNQTGDNPAAEKILRETVSIEPDFYEAYYSLGLLLAEEKRYADAAGLLAVAAKGMPDHARAHYNLGLLLDYLKKDDEAEAALLNAFELEPGNPDFLKAIVEFYLKRKRFLKLRQMAEQMLDKDPSSRLGRELLEFVARSVSGSRP